MAVKRPDLFDVLEVVREKPGCQSYVYRNMLHSKGHRDFTTALVLARLRLKGLGIREWTCVDCGSAHDRDGNAARIILGIGLNTLAEGARR